MIGNRAKYFLSVLLLLGISDCNYQLMADSDVRDFDKQQGNVKSVAALKSHLEKHYSERLEYFGDAYRRLGTRTRDLERMFPDYLFCCAFIKKDGNPSQLNKGHYKIFAVNRTKEKWFDFDAVEKGEESVLVDLTRSQSIHLDSKGKVEAFVDLGILLIGTATDHQARLCGTGVEFKTFVEKSEDGWIYTRNYRSHDNENSDEWYVMLTWKLMLDDSGQLSGIHRSGKHHGPRR